MQQEARNTETHTRDWLSSSLRHKAVQFVKAGDLQRSEFEKVDQPDPGSHDQLGDDSQRASPDGASPPELMQHDAKCGFFFDATPQAVTDTGLPDPIIRTEWSDPDESSEDEVVFTGRKTGTRPIVIETSQEELQVLLQAPPTEPLATQHGPVAVDAPTSQIPRSEQSQNHAQAHAQDTRRWTREDEDTMLADYIANMDTDYHEDTYSRLHADLEGGIDVAQAATDSMSSSPDLDKASEGVPQVGRTSVEGVSKEAHVQSSIDGKCTRVGAESITTLTWKTQCSLGCVSIQKQMRSLIRVMTMMGRRTRTTTTT